MSTVACAVVFLRMAFAMFPIVKYTGHALLSPRNWDSCVLSDDSMRGAIVDPTGNFFYLIFNKSFSSCPLFAVDVILT